MTKRHLNELKGEFIHTHKNKINNSGIISTLMMNDIKIGSGKIHNIYNKIKNFNSTCEECEKIQFGGDIKTKQKIYIENKDICFVGTRVKLENPKIVSRGGKSIKYHYKTIVRKCNKHEHEIKHK